MNFNPVNINDKFLNLKEREETFKSALEKSPMALVIHSADGGIILSNQEAHNILGLSKDQMLGKTPIDETWNFIYEDGSKMMIEDYPVMKVIATKKKLQHYILGIIQPYRNYITWVRVNALPEFDQENGELLRIVVYFSDITLLKSHEKKLVERNKELENREKELTELITTKDKFFRIIGHDLKGPIGQLIQFSNLIEKHYNTLGEDKVKEILKAIKDSSMVSFKLIENLLNWARSQTGAITFMPTTFYLKELIDENILLVQKQADAKQITIEVSAIINQEIFADKNMINTIIRNLLSNAIKFTDEKGSITLYNTFKKDSMVFSIKDNGVGISKDELEKLFKLDGGVKKSGTNDERGTGLGLILCKEFLDYHQGEIHVESSLNVGSTFHFSIPYKNSSTQLKDKNTEQQTNT